MLGYVKAPPDMAYIISGMKKKSKVVIGKASIRIPFFERLEKLNLRLIPIDVKTSNAVPTADYININVDATVNVKISNDPEKLRLAAENFLNKNTEYIASVAREVLEGNVREIVGKMRLEEMVSDRQKFANLVKENAEPDLAAMGLDIISFNVQNFVDGNDVIENLGIDNIVKIKKSAAIAKAESERDIKVAQAAADKESNDAAVEAQTEIAKKQNELAIKKSELQMEADTKKAMADAAYEIQKEEQRKTIEVTTANADIAKQEREIELKQKQVAVTEKSLEAEVKKKAEADKYAAQQRAEADLYQRQKDAEAKQFEAQRAAEAQKAQAEAMRYAKEQEAAQRTVRILDARTGAQDGFAHALDGFILPDDALMQRVLKVKQLLAFALHQLCDRDTRPAADDSGDFLLRHLVAQQAVLALGFFGDGFLRRQLLLELRQFAVLQFCCLVQVILTLGALHFGVHALDFLAQLVHLRDGVLFAFPLRLHLVELVALLRQLLLNFCQTRLCQLVVVLHQRRFLNFQLHDVAVDVVHLCRHGVDFGTNHGARFIHKVNGLIR